MGTAAEATQGDTGTQPYGGGQGVLGISDPHGGSGSSADELCGAQSAGDALGPAGAPPCILGAYTAPRLGKATPDVGANTNERAFFRFHYCHASLNLRFCEGRHC